MKYFFDTEFNEYQKKYLFSKPVNTIEIISIGIISEDNRKYYAVSKEFDLKAAWNKYHIEANHGIPQGLGDKKVYWLRENVLRPIWEELKNRYLQDTDATHYSGDKNKITFEHVWTRLKASRFTYASLKMLIEKYGLTNKQIAFHIKLFTGIVIEDKFGLYFDNSQMKESEYPEFYSYYADYDWVRLCWLYGGMMELPKQFPKYCKDLKQYLDDYINSLPARRYHKPDIDDTFDIKLKQVESCDAYPKQIMEHHALADAKWNYELFNFIKSRWEDK